MVLAVREVLIVVLTIVVVSVEEVLEVVEADQADLIGLLLLGGNAIHSKAEGQKCPYENDVLVHGENAIWVDNAAKVAKKTIIIPSR